jgi:ATP phosphoribosyltransferase regulatory subunit
VLIDLTMIGDFSYYTGMTFEGYAADLGFPVVSGGRYDNLLSQFGRPAPATGFALKTTRILELLGAEDNAREERTLIAYDSAGRSEALAEAQRLRGLGISVVTERVEHSESLGDIRGGFDFSYKGLSYTALQLYVAEKGGQAR